MISTPFVSTPPRGYGGTELVVAELVEGLMARGHDVTLFATGDSITSAQLRSLYAFAQWPPNVLHDINHVTWALAQARSGEFDVVHAHSAAALAYARLGGDLPLVYTLHHARDAELSRFYVDFPEPHYVAISADQARREIPLRHLSVIHHGLDPSCYQCSETPGEHVCFIGRFAPTKGPDAAMDAALAAGVPISVAGECHDVDREFHDREVMPRLAQPHVTYLGSIGMDRKAPLLRDARALLAPISWNEPFGLVLIEAMLSGCPVVAFPRGSVPELVEPGVTGFIAHSAAEMAELIRRGGPLDSFDRARCRARAIERFGRDRMVRGYERLYSQLLAPAGRPGGVELRIA